MGVWSCFCNHIDMIRLFKVVLGNDTEQFVRVDSFNLVSVDCDGLEVRFVFRKHTHLLAFLLA